MREKNDYLVATCTYLLASGTIGYFPQRPKTIRIVARCSANRMQLKVLLV